MRLIAAALVAAASLTSVAQAEIAGPRIEALVGVDSFDNIPGLNYGLGIGYDVALNSNVSIGLDGEILDSTASSTYSWVGSDYSEFEKYSIGRELYVGARLTAKLDEKVNLVLKGGYTRVNSNEVDVYTEEGEVVYYDNDRWTQDGFRAAVGAQYILDKNLYVGGEVRYSNLTWETSRVQGVATLGFRF